MTQVEHVWKPKGGGKSVSLLNVWEQGPSPLPGLVLVCVGPLSLAGTVRAAQRVVAHPMAASL